jgi:ATP-binding cassette subfamily C protein CydC
MVMLVMFAAASFEATAGLPSALQHVPAATESVRRIYELADAEPPVFAPLIPLPPPSARDIQFRNVRFSYDQSPVLSDFCLEIPQGRCMALVGPSGSGKSTVAEILLRFREYEGSVSIGGVEIRDMAESDLHGILAALTQYPHLFNTTIRENIMLGNREAGDDHLQEALYCAGIDAWIESLPLGLDTAVGEGGSAVSGGEARRIALARTLLKGAPILILDEPTEGLDANTEQEVVSRLTRFVKGRTVLLITHRPACMAMAEQVVVMPWIND